jgi:transposase
MKRHEVTDEQWHLVVPILPQRTATTGRKPVDARKMLNGVFWILRTGAPWRDLPERFGPWQTVYDYYSTWRRAGVYDRILEALQIRLDADGKIDWDLWCIDGSSVRASRAAAGACKKVADATPTNRGTTHWAAQEADSAANSTWSLTVRAFRLPSKSPRGKRTNARKSNG